MCGSGCRKGISLQATYTYAHSIDNASSIGGATGVPAQNDQDLEAEEGNSAFDVRHKVTGNWMLELPFGPNRPFLTKGGLWSKTLDGFSVSGDFTFATGTYYTPHLLGDCGGDCDGGGQFVAAGPYLCGSRSQGHRRCRVVQHGGVYGSGEWIYGTASRGSIEGPGMVAVDGSLSRTVSLGETRTFEARVTANNVFNTVQYSGIDTTQNNRRRSGR